MSFKADNGIFVTATTVCKSRVAVMSLPISKGTRADPSSAVIVNWISICWGDVVVSDDDDCAAMVELFTFGMRGDKCVVVATCFVWLRQSFGSHLVNDIRRAILSTAGRAKRDGDSTSILHPSSKIWRKKNIKNPNQQPPP
jgi:hypothetical protein